MTWGSHLTQGTSQILHYFNETDKYDTRLWFLYHEVEFQNSYHATFTYSFFNAMHALKLFIKTSEIQLFYHNQVETFPKSYC
jgi:hypothetical protein